MNLLIMLFNQGSHPDYTKVISRELTRIDGQLFKNTISDAEAYKEVLELISNAKNAIKNGKGMKINDLTF